jgi:hypothetical protein
MRALIFQYCQRHPLVPAVALTLALATVCARAENWHLIHADAYGKNYVDTDSIRYADSIARYWARTDYPSPQANLSGKRPFVSLRMEQEADCQNRTLLSNSSVAYDAAGKIVATEKGDGSETPEYVVSGTLNALELRFVCASAVAKPKAK